MLGANRKKVYLVDDHPTTLLALSTVLASASNLEVSGQAQDGLKAFSEIVASPPDLVILDLNLPGMDGLRLISKIRHKGLTCKVLVFSSTDPRLAAARVAQVGGNGFMGKDLDAEHILATVRTVLMGFNCFPVDLNAPTDGDFADPLARLTPRELTIILALARGQTNREIAGELHLSEKTVSTYKVSAMTKLNLSSVLELVAFARVHGLIL
jgi:DNA-binding NarL/FixJ family response regulator